MAEDVLCNLEYDRTLGAGSYGKVYLVRNTDTDEKFAVKEVDLSKYCEEERETALKEANLLAKLDHGGILKYIESVISEECLYIVTEYCEGGDVDVYLQKCKMKDILIPESVICSWIMQVSDALQYLHKNRILHRDLKTKNIFLLKTFCIKLGDFGIAKALDPSRSMAESFIGTPAYMSPEIFSYKPYNYKTDIWSLGCCAIEMMTLKKAFQGGYGQIIQGVIKGQMPVLPEMYSTDLRKLILQFLDREPDKRPSASDVVKNTTLIKGKKKSRDEVSKLPVPDAEEEASKQQTRKGSQGHVPRKSSFQNVIMAAHEREEEVERQSIKNALDKFNSLHLMGGTSNTAVKKVELKDDEEEEEDFVETFIVHENDEQRRDSTLMAENPLQKSVHTNIKNVEAKHVKKAWMVDLDGNEKMLNTKQPREPKKLSEDTDGKAKGLDVEQSRNTGKMKATFVKPVSSFGTTYTVSKFASMDLRSSSEHIIPAEENPASNSGSDVDDVDEQITMFYDRQMKKSDITTDSDSDFENEKQRVSISETERLVFKPLRSKSGSGTRLVISSEVEEEGVEEPQFGAHEIVQHVRGHLYAFDPPSQEQVSSEIKKKKKKNVLKKHAGRKKRDNTVEESREIKKLTGRKKWDNTVEESREIKKAVTDEVSVKKGRAITLFTRAQNVRYVKDGESLSMESSIIKDGPGFTPFDKRTTSQDLKDLVVLVSSEDNETLTMDQLIQVQQELVQGIGSDNLQKALDILSITSDEQDVRLHFEELLGPEKFLKYKQHLFLLRMLEMKSAAR